MKGKPLSQEDWDKVRLLDSKRVFTKQQLSNITGLSKATINNIMQFATYDEYKAVRLAAVKLANERKTRREQEAKEAYEAAQQELSGEDPFSIDTKLDIVIEKMDTIIRLLSENVASNIGAEYQSPLNNQYNNKPF